MTAGRRSPPGEPGDDPARTSGSRPPKLRVSGARSFHLKPSSPSGWFSGRRWRRTTKRYSTSRAIPKSPGTWSGEHRPISTRPRNTGRGATEVGVGGGVHLADYGEAARCSRRRHRLQGSGSRRGPRIRGLAGELGEGLRYGGRQRRSGLGLLHRRDFPRMGDVRHGQRSLGPCPGKGGNDQGGCLEMPDAKAESGFGPSPRRHRLFVGASHACTVAWAVPGRRAGTITP